MRYLSKDERREEILQAAMRVALTEGFAAMTVRRIATEAGVATGQVHHHFASAGELKSLAFVRLIRDLLDAEIVGENAGWRERLHAMLGSDDGGFEPYIDHGDVAPGIGRNYPRRGGGQRLYAC